MTRTSPARRASSEWIIERGWPEKLMPEFATAHPGLLLDRTYFGAVSDPGKRGKYREQFRDRICEHEVDGLYQYLIHERRKLFAESDQRSIWTQALRRRLKLGGGEASLHDIALTLDAVSGMPIIPGSAQKNLVRRYVRLEKVREQMDGQLSGVDVDYVIAALLGSVESDGDESGCVDFLDAWWCPDKDPRPFAAEALAPHHKNYFAQEGGVPPSDTDSPDPTQQIAARGEFLFIVEGPSGWHQLASALLRDGLADLGVGGRGKMNYGVFFREGSNT